MLRLFFPPGLADEPHSSEKNGFKCCVANISSENTRSTLFRALLPETSPLCEKGCVFMRERVQLRRGRIYRQHFPKRLPSIMLLAIRRFVLRLGTGFCEPLRRDGLLTSIFVSSSFLFSPKDLASVNRRLQCAGTLPNTNHCRGFYVYLSAAPVRPLRLSAQ